MPSAGAVLMHHRIAGPSGVAVRFSVRPLLEVVERGDGVAITLDDGKVDARAAAEILDELGLPATCFVTSARLDEPHESSHRCLLGDELEALARRHAIDAHEVEHLHLSSLSEVAQRRELGDCKHALERRLSRAVDALAYPYGAYDERAVAVARELGFRCAVTVEERAVRTGEDRLRVPRVDAQRLEAAELIERLDGMLR